MTIYTTRGRHCTEPADRMSGDDTKQSTGASKVKEGATLERKERSSL